MDDSDDNESSAPILILYVCGTILCLLFLMVNDLVGDVMLNSLELLECADICFFVLLFKFLLCSSQATFFFALQVTGYVPEAYLLGKKSAYPYRRDFKSEETLSVFESPKWCE